MTTFKALVIPSQKRADGTYNVKIRVTHNRKSKYIKTPHYVNGKDLQKRNGEYRIRNQAIIDSMDEIILNYKKRMLSAGMVVSSWDVEKLVSFISSESEAFKLDFIRYGYDYGDSLIARGRESTGKSYHIAMNSIVRFLGRNSMDISEVTVSFLKAYEKYLTNEPVYKGCRGGGSAPTGQRKKGRALSLYIGKIKTLYEAAKNEYNDEERGIINIPYSPFAKYEIPSVGLSKHRVLTMEQIQAVIDYPYRTIFRGKMPEVNTAKDVFVLSFALMGINTADLYDPETKVKDGMLIYCRKKTRNRRKDKAMMKVRIEPEIMPLVKKYIKEGSFIFNRHYSNSVNMNKVVNQGLKRIGKDLGIPNLTHYHARHTMATICANKLNVDIARVDEMLNHSDPRLALARVYIERDFSPLWEANRRLIGLFDWSFYQEKAEG